MPLNFRLPGARLARSRWLVLCLVSLGALLATLPLLGRFLYVEDRLQPANAILVLSGTFAERPLEAADLYHSGYAPVVVLTREAPDGGQAALARRGIPFPDRADLARDLLVRLGVPATAIILLSSSHDSTADEATSFCNLVRQRGWRRVIVVTSKMHTRRARLAVSRRCRGVPVEICMRASRYDVADPAHWWRRRADVRFAVFELQKYALYWLGMMK